MMGFGAIFTVLILAALAYALGWLPQSGRPTRLDTSRFKAIFQAQANAVADQLEDPKASLDFSLTKLEENRRQLSRSMIEVSAAKCRLEHLRDEVAAAVEKYEKQARAAVEAGRRDDASAERDQHKPGPHRPGAQAGGGGTPG